MHEPPTKQKATASPPTSHPRRLPAHLSVSLRHGPTGVTKYRGPRSETRWAQNALQSSAASNHTGDSILMTAEKWFDHSNMRPNAGVQPTFDDGEPPYLLPQHSSSNDPAFRPQNVGYRSSQRSAMLSGDESSAGDYRSVIDDLTVENRKLRERLRKYESRYNSDLEQDKIFELKIHRGIPSRMTRELENILQQFVSNVDAPEGQNSRLVVNTSAPRQLLKPPAAMQQRFSSSNSNLRPRDSAYASMSGSGPTSISTLNRNGPEVRIDDSQLNHAQKIEDFLHDMPEGLLPKHSPVMTERQKKKMVVKRLEQIFTGQVDGIFGDHSHPLQQQEISNVATLEQVSESLNHFALPEGLREAHISTEMDSAASSLKKDASTDSSIDENPKALTDSSPRQRPTRPLDLDPDRAQVPLDNVEYIRHLGLSTPQLIQSHSGDAEPGAQGWIPLNLLIGMAQLHIINVTPDFVRSAVADVSTKFQLSIDGRLIRWRGGREGTRLSSDSEGSKEASHSPQDSESHEESNRKQAKANGYTARAHPQGQFSSIPPRTQICSTAAPPRGQYFHYKPLFHRRYSDEDSMSLDDTDSIAQYASISGTGKSWQAHLKAHESRADFSIKSKRDGGSIVFYQGAKFCTDLSGDRGDISIPHHICPGVGRDKHSMAQEVLGDTNQNRPHQLGRTPSGSLLAFRPFKDYPRGPQFLETEETRPKTPELLSGTSDVDIFLGDLSPKLQPAQRLQEFDACGLGGTRPADHFTMTVATRIAKIDSDTHTPASKFPASRPNARKYSHSIPRESLDVFRTLEQDMVATEFTSLNAPSSPSPVLHGAHAPKPTLRREILSSHFQSLEPSKLPRPSAYFSDDSTSEEEESDSEDSFTSVSHLRYDHSMPRPFNPASSDSRQRPGVLATKELPVMDMDEAEGERDDSGVDGESDDSIDMLAHARQADPKMVAAQEKAFDMEADSCDGTNRD